MSEAFDLIVIGSGPAGEKGAAHAAYHGKRVALVEQSATLGGEVVSRAGVPTKTLRETALYVSGFRKRDVYGVSIDVDRQRALDVLRTRTTEVVNHVGAQVASNMARHGVVVVHGRATIVDNHTVAVRGGDGGERVISGSSILLAPGSRPLHPPEFPMADPDVHDSNSMLTVDRLIESAVVVGGGPVGCEYSSIFAALGIKVTLIDVADRLLPFMDAEVSAALRDSFASAGMRILLDERVEKVTRRTTLEVHLESGEVLAPDILLVAVGRSGRTDGLRLEELGVRLDRKGLIVVDSEFRTSVPGIFAAGDVLGAPALASVSAEQGRLAASFAIGSTYGEGGRFEPPYAVYSLPEAAMIGLTEARAQADGIDCEVGRCRFTDNTRAIIAGSTEGLLKLVFRRDNRQLLGVHVVGETASEMVHQGQAVLQHGGSLDYFIHATFNVPTWSEAYKHAAFDGLGRLEPGSLMRRSR